MPNAAITALWNSQRDAQNVQSFPEISVLHHSELCNLLWLPFSSFAPHRFSNLKIKQLWLTGGGGRDGGGGGGGSLMTWINRRSKRASAQPVRRHIGTRTNTRAQTSSRRAQTRLTEVIRDRWLSQTETSLSSSHGGDAVAASLFCSSDCCPIASLTADYKDSACKPTSGAPRAK